MFELSGLRAIRVLTVTVHLDASVVVTIIAQLPVQKVRTFQLNVCFVLEIIRQIIRDVNFLKISKLTETVIHLNNNDKSYVKNANIKTYPCPNSTSENQSFSTTTILSYAQATQNINQTANINQPQLDSFSPLTAQPTSFINDLKSLITLLITLLTKVIDISLDKK